MKLLTATAIIAVLSTSAQAETQLKPIITASRVAQTADQTITAVTIISQTEIKQSQSQSLPELLRLRVPGLDFSTTGGIGHQTSAFLRGTSSDNVLVLIDGNIIGSATTGAAALAQIPLQQIEKIEVVRGPRSALYGSDAIGGVIQVFTLQGSDTTSASLQLGSHDTVSAEATVGFANRSSRLTVSANHFRTDGFDVTDDTEADDDGYENSSINFNLKHSLNKSTSVHAGLLHAEAETEFDNLSFDNVSDSTQQSARVGLETRVNDDWGLSADIGQTLDRLETDRNTEDFFSPGTFNFEQTLFETRRQQLRLLNSINISTTGIVTIGIDYLNDEVESTTNYAVNERDNRGIYALVQEKFGAHQIQLSGRVDNNEAFGIHRTAGAAWSYDITGAIRTSVSHSTAFIAPSFNDLYFDDPFFVGNPNLDPETSKTTEVAIIGNQRWGSWELRAYQTEISDLIINVSSDPSNPFAPFTTQNANRAEIDGLELELTSSTANWNNRISFSYVDAANVSDGTQLQNRARRTLKWHANSTVQDYLLSLDVLAQSSRFANVTNTQTLAGYGIANISVEKPVAQNWALKARIENLFDKAYSTSTDFFGNETNNTPRSFYISLNYQN